MLNKKLCQQCVRVFYKEIMRHSTYYEENVRYYNRLFKHDWRLGYCICPHYHDEKPLTIQAKPFADCLYALEQVIINEKVTHA